MVCELKKIKIESFKKLESFETELSNINILVGANGSGKSSVLQGLHLACCTMRQASKVGATSCVVSVGELDYLPTDAYPELGNKNPWRNKLGQYSSKIKLFFANEDNKEVSAWCELRAARNRAGISINGNIQQSLLPILRRNVSRKNVFSAYIPGISGIPNKEEKASKRVVQRACSFGDSNAYMRNILFLIKENNEIKTLEEWVNKVICPQKIKINISFNENDDLFLECNVSLDDHEMPLELIGTGYLQLIQIFSYILFLKPGLVLIDEPDNHLHPSIQERLPAVLNECAEENRLKIILASHSPYVVRGAPIDAKILWMENGALTSKGRANLELTLGWGIMGKKLIIFSEDQDTSFLQKIISQWPELERQIKIHPGSGYQNLIKPEQAKQIIETLQNSIAVLIHRDGDALTDKEMDILKGRYEDVCAYLWITRGTDVEAYFCDENVISKVCGVSKEEATEKLKDAVNKEKSESEAKFQSHRAAHNKEIWTEGGSPTNDEAFQEMGKRLLKGAYGKGVLKALRNAFNKGEFNNDKIISAKFDDVEIAADLKEVLTNILK